MWCWSFRYVINKVNLIKESELLYAIDTFSKCAWVIPLKDKKGVTIVNAFLEILDDLRRIQTKYG